MKELLSVVAAVSPPVRRRGGFVQRWAWLQCLLLLLQEAVVVNRWPCAVAQSRVVGLEQASALRPMPQAVQRSGAELRLSVVQPVGATVGAFG